MASLRRLAAYCCICRHMQARARADDNANKSCSGHPSPPRHHGVDHQQHWGVTRIERRRKNVQAPCPSGNHSPASSCNNDARADAGSGRQKLGQQLLDFRVALKRLHHRVAFANFLEAVVYLPSALRIANIASHFSPLSRRLAVLFFRARIPMHASRKERKRVSKSDGHMVCFLC